MIEEVEYLAQILKTGRWRIVFAESCTAGLASALLASVPGISAHLCGSWVTYREECKQAWLGVPATLIGERTAVSPEVTERMAIEALRRTESAHLSAAITGHLGPEAPSGMDGVCFLAVAMRRDSLPMVVGKQRIMLIESTRVERQHSAARALLRLVAETLSSNPSPEAIV